MCHPGWIGYWWLIPIPGLSSGAIMGSYFLFDSIIAGTSDFGDTDQPASEHSFLLPIGYDCPG